MFDEQAFLFCHRLKRTDSGLVREGLSFRYTIITLMGLRRLEQSGIESPIAIAPVLKRVLSDLPRIETAGDFGLLLWLCAVAAPDYISDVEQAVDLPNVLTRYRDIRAGHSMELAWLLTGLCCSAIALPGKAAVYEPIVQQVYAMLRGNQGPSGAFRHLARSGSFSGRVRGWLGSFADQVYPIYAMTRFARVYGDGDALHRALRCADLLCSAQGREGQWWWHYDSSTGRVLDPYPVFSVHQHGMAPMVLFELGDVVHRDFRPHIYRGLQWIYSRNELHVNMEATSDHIIWRCIQPSGVKRFCRAAFHSKPDDLSSHSLKVLYECRPYELGWLLYALSGRR
jgi:hypothetical protein